MNSKRNFILTLVCFVAIASSSIFQLRAQETQETPLDTQTRRVHKLQDDFAIIKKLKE